MRNRRGKMGGVIVFHNADGTITRTHYDPVPYEAMTKDEILKRQEFSDRMTETFRKNASPEMLDYLDRCKKEDELARKKLPPTPVITEKKVSRWKRLFK